MPEGIKELVYPILKEELIPALGCTEPIAIAYACAKAKEVLGAFPEKMTVRCSGNIVKNVKGVVVPNTVNLKGIKTAALMGVVCGDASKGLQVIAGSTAQDVARVKELLKSDLCKVELIEGEENLQIWAVLEQAENQVQLQIKREHTNITKIIKNGEVLLDKDDCSSQPVSAIDRSRLTVESIVAYVENEDLSEIRPLLEKQVECNMAIAEEGLKNPFGSQVGRIMMKNNPNDLFTKVIAYAASGSDARMSGCNLLFLQIPGETARAELDVDTALPGGERFLRRAPEGFCLEDGVWLFPLESPEGAWSGDWYEGAAYTLRLYREDGALLLGQSGTVRES